MKTFWPYLIVGIVNGSIYALAAMGLVLTWKTSGVFNFAHGAQAALAAFLMFEFRQRDNLPWPIAALLALLLAGVVAGLILERLAVVFATAPQAARVGATVGILVAIQAVLTAVFGSLPLRAKYLFPTHPVRFAGVNVTYNQIIVTLLVAGAAAVLYWFLNTRRLGATMQGLVDDPVLLASQGISPVVVRQYAWVIGSVFAASSGILLAPITGLNVQVLTLLVFFAFGAAAVGMFSSLLLTYAGGLGIGIGASLLSRYIHTANAASALPATLPFLVLVAALLIVPKGKLVERGSQVVRRTLPPLRLDAVSHSSLTLVGLAALLIVPFVAHARLLTFTTTIGFVVIFASLSLLVRESGQISLCQMTFAAVGADAFAHAIKWGLPWPLAVLVGGLVAVPVGALVAIPAIRLSGVYLAIATFGFALLVQDLFFPSFLMFHKFTSVLKAPRPHLGSVHLETETGYYYVALIVAVLCLVLLGAVRRGRLGRLLRSLRDSPVALDAHGTNTDITRLLVFCISAFVAGVGGSMISPVTGTVNALSYDFSISLLLVAVLFLGGRQPVLGPFIAAILYIAVPSYINSSLAQEYIPVAFGAGVVLVALFGGYPVLDRIRVSRMHLEREGRSPLRDRFHDVPEMTGVVT